VTVDGAGNLYIADTATTDSRGHGHGVITTFAGNGLPGYSGDNGAATRAQLEIQRRWRWMRRHVYVADGSLRVRKFLLRFITTIAGSSQRGYLGDGATRFSRDERAVGVAVDATATCTSDTGNNAVRLLEFAGSV
jgi:hypothetical protein